MLGGPRRDAGRPGYDAATDDTTDPDPVDSGVMAFDEGDDAPPEPDVAAVMDVTTEFDTGLVDDAGFDAGFVDDAGFDAGVDVPTDVASDVVVDSSIAPITVAFQNGVAPSATYAGTRDTFISQGTPTATHGGALAVEADGDNPGMSGQDDVGLIQWNISAIPTGSTVLSAQITVSVTNTGVAAYPLYEIKRSWSESQANWTLAATGASWAGPGASGASDRGTSVVGSLAGTALGSLTITLDAEGVALVQRWVSTPSSNHGLLIASASNPDGVAFASREAPTPSDRPRLTVRYQPR